MSEDKLIYLFRDPFKGSLSNWRRLTKRMVMNGDLGLEGSGQDRF
jgi:hypothetical protein